MRGVRWGGKEGRWGGGEEKGRDRERESTLSNAGAVTSVDDAELDQKQ